MTSEIGVNKNRLNIARTVPGVWLIVLATFAGCAGPRKVATPAEDSTKPHRADLIAAQNQRVAGLKQTYSYGVLELKWTDEDGEHSEPQVDVDLWIDLPHRTALRVNKLGEVYFWIGSDERSYWVFDLLSQEDRSAIIRDRNPGGTESMMTYFGIEPDSLLDLMALRPLADPGDDEAMNVEESETPPAWVLNEAGANGSTRIFFQKGTLRPIRVELCSPDGEVLMHSTLSRYESVALAGVSTLAFPKCAMWIDIVDVAGGGFAKMHLNEMTADVEDQPFGAVFDLERLLRQMRPDRVDAPTNR